MARVHRAGLLGFLGVGWFIAAAYSAVHLVSAVRRRTALAVLQSAQALVFQLVAGLGLLLLVSCICAGFLLLGGAIDFLPELPAIDPLTLWGAVVIVLWIVAVIATPIWYVWTLRVAWRAARSEQTGELYAYPFVGQLVWDEAPRVFKWMVIEQSPSEGDGGLESPR